jgi:hypothetical protein
MADINEFYKTDIAFKSDFVKTAAGDLDIISGVENVKEALFRRLITVKGSLIHRPDYGVGIKLFQGSMNSLPKQRQITNLIQEQFIRDSRVDEVLGVSINYSDKEPQKVTIHVRVKLVGYGEQNLSFLPFGSDA